MAKAWLPQICRHKTQGALRGSPGINYRVDSVAHQAFCTAALRGCQAGAEGRQVCAQQVPDVLRL